MSSDWSSGQVLDTEPAPEATPAPRTLSQLIKTSRFEIVPLSGAAVDVLKHLPQNVTLTVTVSPVKGLEPSLTLADAVTRHGYAVVPHFPARLVRDRVHLAEIVARFERLGVRDVFVVAGDSKEPAGVYSAAAPLLRDLAKIDHPFDHIGIPGYPEGHPLIGESTVWAALAEKAPHASYIVTQMCFDSAVTMRWIGEVRARGIQLPIYVGIPGAVGRAKLLRTSARCGIGESIRFLRKHGGLVTRFLRRDGFRPDSLIRALSLDDPDARIAGFHVFTFNDLEGTAAWRRKHTEA